MRRLPTQAELARRARISDLARRYGVTLRLAALVLVIAAFGAVAALAEAIETRRYERARAAGERVGYLVTARITESVDVHATGSPRAPSTRESLELTRTEPDAPPQDPRVPPVHRHPIRSSVTATEGDHWTGYFHEGRVLFSPELERAGAGVAVTRFLLVLASAGVALSATLEHRRDRRRQPPRGERLDATRS